MIHNSLILTLAVCSICFGSLICGVITSTCGYYKLFKYYETGRKYNWLVGRTAKLELVVLFTWSVAFYTIAFLINFYVIQ